MTKPPEHTDLTPRSAGRLMITKIPVIHPGATIAEVEKLLLNQSRDLQSINYIYITDNQNRLEGVISVKEVFRSVKTTKVADIMQKEIISVRPHTDQERAALLSIEHNIKEIPVVDAEKHLLGVVPSEAILNVLNQESIEDILKFAGIHKFRDPAKDIIAAQAGVYLKKRLPWLAVGLIGGIIAAWVVDFFENTLRLEIIIASFIPAIVYIADAVGTQTETILIRSLAIKPTLNFRNYISRELKVIILIGLLLSAAVFFISYIFWRNQSVSLILGLSFLTTILAAAFVAVLLPWIFLKFKIDPAIASGPFATIIRDILSLVIYFTIALLILKNMAG